MPHFNSHFTQAKKNLKFLSEISVAYPKGYWDWKVTVAFYAALHLVNGHINKTTNNSYRTHKETNQALNPYNKLSLSKIPEEECLRYEKLHNLSRRSRYLCSEKVQNRIAETQKSYNTYDKHFAKCMRHLDKLMHFFGEKYNIDFEAYSCICLGVNKDEFVYWNILEPNYAVKL